MENRQIISDNGFDDKITLIHGKVEDVDLPVPKVLSLSSHPSVLMPPDSTCCLRHIVLETHYVVLSCALGSSCLSCARACMHIPWCGCWFAQFPQCVAFSFARQMRCREAPGVCEGVMY
jgi:hypothetical protein